MGDELLGKLALPVFLSDVHVLPPTCRLDYEQHRHRASVGGQANQEPPRRARIAGQANRGIRPLPQ
ncbi:hypothetical protein PGTUg99_018805 [Puccinia graminis f. sp. tritici]|uniref:Uncharacterized protein n=1 Tax=Puccinia graminis f. sp. tritici TaxID=56615 RepID=A0A5B0RCA9_PUCGR|nr:hypothetical protein PGTUg99_018805 [Puccinia graminis f. sp. tritici]